MIFSSTVFALPEVKPLKPILAEGVKFDGTQGNWSKEKMVHRRINLLPIRISRDKKYVS